MVERTKAPKFGDDDGGLSCWGLCCVSWVRASPESGKPLLFFSNFVLFIQIEIEIKNALQK